MTPDGRQTLIKGLVVIALSATGALGFFLGASLASPEWDRQSLVQQPGTIPTARLLGCRPGVEPPQSVKLTKTFVNSQYRYAFRYPEGYTVVSEDDGRAVKVLVYGETVVTFSIRPPSEDDRVLDEAISTIRELPRLQQTLIELAEKGATPADRGLPRAHIDSFVTRPETPRHLAVGFSVLMGLEDNRETFIRIRGGHVVRAEGNYCFSVGDHPITENIIATLDPFLD